MVFILFWCLSVMKIITYCQMYKLEILVRNTGIIPKTMVMYYSINIELADNIC